MYCDQTGCNYSWEQKVRKEGGVLFRPYSVTQLTRSRGPTAGGRKLLPRGRAIRSHSASKSVLSKCVFFCVSDGKIAKALDGLVYTISPLDRSGTNAGSMSPITGIHNSKFMYSVLIIQPKGVDFGISMSSVVLFCTSRQVDLEHSSSRGVASMEKYWFKEKEGGRENARE